MDPTESDFFAKAVDSGERRPGWAIPLLVMVAAVGAIIAWYVLVRPPAAPVAPVAPQEEPAPIVKAPEPAAPAFSTPASTEHPEKPPAPPKDFDK